MAQAHMLGMAHFNLSRVMTIVTELLPQRFDYPSDLTQSKATM
jgi:hypothetical protein